MKNLLFVHISFHRKKKKLFFPTTMICMLPLKYAETSWHDDATMLDEHFQHIR